MRDNSKSPSIFDRFGRRIKRVLFTQASSTPSTPSTPSGPSIIGPQTFPAIEHQEGPKPYYKVFKTRGAWKPLNEPICIIMFTNRSGSSLLCEHLRATNRFTGFGEPLNHRIVTDRANLECIESFPNYLYWEVEHARRKDCMFGLKASHGQAAMLVRSGAIPHFFNDVNWVVIHREDILAQAISLSIAHQTKQWSSNIKVRKSEARFDFMDIETRLEELSSAKTALRAFCTEQGINPYHINYEELEVDPKTTTKKLARHLGAGEVAFDESRINLQRQRNAQNDEFKERFLEEYQGPTLTGRNAINGLALPSK